MSGELVVKAKSVPGVPDLINACRDLCPAIQRIVASLLWIKITSINGLDRILGKCVFEICQKKLLVLLLVVEAEDYQSFEFRVPVSSPRPPLSSDPEPRDRAG